MVAGAIKNAFHWWDERITWRPLFFFVFCFFWVEGGGSLSSPRATREDPSTRSWLTNQRPSQVYTTHKILCSYIVRSSGNNDNSVILFGHHAGISSLLQCLGRAKRGRYWHDSHPQHYSRADKPAGHPHKSHYCTCIINALKPSVSYMHGLTRASLNQIMAWRLLGAKPISEWWDIINCYDVCSRKCIWKGCLQNITHFFWSHNVRPSIIVIDADSANQLGSHMITAKARHHLSYVTWLTHKIRTKWPSYFRRNQWYNWQ